MSRAIVIVIGALLWCSPSDLPPRGDRLTRFLKYCLCLSLKGIGWLSRRCGRHYIWLCLLVPSPLGQARRQRSKLTPLD